MTSGFLLIDKPAGFSSFDVIRHLRKQTGIRDFGHAGTLDPFATGLLILAVNNYTRLLPLLEYKDKTYDAVLTLGAATTTGDPSGDVTETSDRIVNEDDLQGLCEAVLSIEKLKPPTYSAVWVNGKRAYKQARKGEIPDLSERESHIHCFKVTFFEFPYLRYVCTVSKGTYIRSLSLWIASYLNSTGHTSSLARTAIDDISLERAVQLDSFYADNLSQYLLNVLDILPEMESIRMSAMELYKIRQGQNTASDGPDNPCLLIMDDKDTCHGYGYRINNRFYPKVNL